MDEGDRFITEVTEYAEVRCNACGGKGYFVDWDDGRPDTKHNVTCRYCNGTGKALIPKREWTRRAKRMEEENQRVKDRIRKIKDILISLQMEQVVKGDLEDIAHRIYQMF